MFNADWLVLNIINTSSDSYIEQQVFIGAVLEKHDNAEGLMASNFTLKDTIYLVFQIKMEMEWKWKQSFLIYPLLNGQR